MAGPWEKYQTQQSGPWVKYQGTAPQAQPSADDTDLMGLLRQSPAGQGQAVPQQSSVDVADPVKGDPTMVTTVLDNVVGIDNGVMSPGEKIGTALNNAGESLTIGAVGDEAAAAFDAMLGRGTYDDRLSFYRENQEQFREENPVLSFASELAPALIPGLGGAKLVQALTTKLGRAGAGAALGALSGLVYGFAEGEGGGNERLVSGGATAALGGLFGAAAPKIMDTVSGLPRRVSRAFTRSQERPNVETLRAAKNAAYRAVDEAGEVFSGDDMTGLYQKVSDAFESGNYVEETDNALRATLKILERRSGQNTKLGQLDGIRQNLWKRYAGAKDQPQILDAIKAIDELIDQRAGASSLMTAARAANSRYAKLQLLEDAFTKAADQTAGAGSGGNILNKYRQAVTAIINNEKKARFFTGEEIDLMRSFVRGNVSENVLRRIGKLSPNGNGLMMALHVIGGVASQGASLPLMAVGAGAKSAADRRVMQGAELVKDVVSGYRGVPQSPQLSLPQGAVISGAIPEIENGANYLREALRR